LVLLVILDLPHGSNLIEILLTWQASGINRNSIKRGDMISVRQIKAARALVDWSQGELSAASGVSEPTIARLESEDGPLGGRVETSKKLMSALEKAGIEFIEENGGGPGVRLRKVQGPVRPK
jgi:DNA-binding XRE family transcriptional regulator